MSTSGTGPVNTAGQIVSLGDLNINGARLTYATTTTFTVGKGQVRDSTNSIDMIVGATIYSSATNPGGEQGADTFTTSVPVTVNVSLLGAGGLDVGTIAASTYYYVYLIGDSRGFNVATGILSLSSTKPGLPLGYDSYRHIGGVSINSSSHIRPFVQTGAQALRTIWYDPGTGPSTAGVVIPSSATTGSTSYINAGVFTTLIPQTALEVILGVALTPNAAGDVAYFAPATIDNGTTATVGSMAAIGAEVTGHAQTGVVRVPVSLPNATQVAALTISATAVTALVATTSASDSMVLLLNGYIDQL